MPEPELVAAIQAAALAGDYPLAINLIREHDLSNYCLSCVCEFATGVEGFAWEFSEWKQTLRTCRACTEPFALWYVSKSPSRRMFQGALHGTTFK